MVITSCSLGGDIRTWKWAWSVAPATDAEGNIMCSIYDRELIAQEKRRAVMEGREYEGPGSSAPSSRPGTSNSSQMFSRKSSVSKDIPTPLSGRPGSKEGARQHQGGRERARPSSKEGTRPAGSRGADRPGSKESARPSTAASSSTGELSKKELRELEARASRQRKWDEAWEQHRALARSGLHLQETDLQLFCRTRRLVQRSYVEGEQEQEQEQEQVTDYGQQNTGTGGASGGVKEANLKDVFGDAEDVPGRVQSLDHDEHHDGGPLSPSGGGMDHSEKRALIEKLKVKLEPVFKSEGVLWGDAVTMLEALDVDELKTGVETGEVGPIMMRLVDLEGGKHEQGQESPSTIWAREWVFMAKLAGAGGLDNDVEMGHPRLHVCPVDSSLLAVCSGLSVEIWVNQAQSVNPQDSQALLLRQDSSSEEEEEMDYSFGTPAVVQGAMNRFKDSFINWQLRADLREHRDIVRAVAWRLDGRLLASADSAGQIKFWARGWDSGVQRLQKFSMGAGGWCCYQTLDVPVNILQRMPEEAAIFSRPPSDTAPSNLSSPTASRPSTSASRASAGSLDSRVEDFPDNTNAQIMTLAFGVGPCAVLLFAGLDDDTVCIIDTGGLAELLETPYPPGDGHKG